MHRHTIDAHHCDNRINRSDQSQFIHDPALQALGRSPRTTVVSGSSSMKKGTCFKTEQAQNGSYSPETLRVNINEMKQKFGDKWMDSVSRVRQVEKSDGSVVKEYIIEDPAIFENWRNGIHANGRHCYENGCRCDVGAASSLSLKPCEITGSGADVAANPHRGAFYATSTNNNDQEKERNRRSSERGLNYDAKMSSGNSQDRVRYEIVDADGNAIEIDGNINQLKQLAGSMREVKQADGTVIKEYVLDDPELLTKIQTNIPGDKASTAPPPRSPTANHDQSSRWRQIQQPAPAAMEPRTPPTNESYHPKHGELTDELIELESGKIYRFRCSTGKIVTIDIQNGQAGFTELYELKDALQTFLNQTAKGNPFTNKQEHLSRDELVEKHPHKVHENEPNNSRDFRNVPVDAVGYPNPSHQPHEFHRDHKIDKLEPQYHPQQHQQHQQQPPHKQYQQQHQYEHSQIRPPFQTTTSSAAALSNGRHTSAPDGLTNFNYHERSNTNQAAPALIDLSSINPTLGTYPIDSKGHIVGDISYQLTRDELEFIRNQLMKDGINLNLSNVIPADNRYRNRNDDQDHYRRHRTAKKHSGGNMPHHSRFFY